MKILGVKVDQITLPAAISALDEKQVIFTPNPEIILKAFKSKKYNKALKNGTLMLPDGHGLMFVSKLLKIKSKFLRLLFFLPFLALFLVYKKPFKSEIPEIIHGSDFMSVVISWAEMNGKSVFFLGGSDGVAQQTANYFLSRHSKLRVAGYSSLDPSDEALDFVNWSRPDVLFVAYGAPKQEMWISKNLKKLKDVHVIMAVGGSFDFWSGNIRRAPKFFRVIGLEWLWRLILNPLSRIKRIWNALFVFPITCLFSSS